MDDFGGLFDLISTTPSQSQYCAPEFNGGGSINLESSIDHFPSTTIKQEYTNNGQSSASAVLPKVEINNVDNSQDRNSLDYILDNAPQTSKPLQPVFITGHATKIPSTRIGVSCAGQSAKTIFIPIQNNNSLKTVRIIKAANIQNRSAVTVKSIIPGQKQLHVGHVPQITQCHSVGIIYNV